MPIITNQATINEYNDFDDYASNLFNRFQQNLLNMNENEEFDINQLISFGKFKDKKTFNDCPLYYLKFLYDEHPQYVNNQTLKRLIKVKEQEKLLKKKETKKLKKVSA